VSSERVRQCAAVALRGKMRREKKIFSGPRAILLKDQANGAIYLMLREEHHTDHEFWPYLYESKIREVFSDRLVVSCFYTTFGKQEKENRASVIW
jgi:hypothetical protein